MLSLPPARNTNSSNLIRNSPTSLCTVSRETVHRLMVHFHIAGHKRLQFAMICLESCHSFIHSFRPFLLRLFKSSTTQRRSRLQHGYCIGVSRRSAHKSCVHAPMIAQPELETYMVKEHVCIRPCSLYTASYLLALFR